MKISVVCATYNRIRTLKGVVNDLLKQKVSEDIDYEIIVVDNNSSDETLEYLQKLESSHSHLKVLHEGKQGQAHAINTGIHKAKGDIIVLTDDDVFIHENWVQTVSDIYRKNPELVAICGPVVAHQDISMPRWYSEKISGVLGIANYGPVWKSVKYCIGANAAYRKSVLEEIGPFSASSRFPDVEFANRLRKKKYRIFHFPEIKIGHDVSRERLNKEYFRNWHALAGQLQSDIAERNSRMFMNVELWRYKQALKHVLLWMKNIFNESGRFYYELELTFFMAFMKRRWKEKKASHHENPISVS